MKRLLAKVNPEVAKDRLKKLQEEFKDYEFQVNEDTGDNKTEILLVNVRTGVNVDEPTVAQMRRYAQGLVPEKKKADPKAKNKQTTVGQLPSPAGGGGPAMATPTR